MASRRIVSYPAPRRPLLEGTAAGRVLSVHRRSVYVELRPPTGGAILAIVDAELGNGPLNLVADRLDTEQFCLRQGDRVCLVDGQMTVGGGSFPGAKPLTLSVREARPHDPHLRLCATDLDPKAVSACAAFVAREGPADGLAVLLSVLDATPRTRALPSAWQQKALAAAQTLLRGLRTDEADEIRSGAQRLCGLGLGLTPSGDDFLVGVLIGLRLAGADPRPIVEAATDTTRISRAYLEAAAHGQANEPWHDLLQALRSEGGWEPSARRLLRWGETSGADMMAGFFAWWNGCVGGRPPVTRYNGSV
ncbi:MAG: DUF2877 domain-containing protein [Armatimonadota bacterium]|nr:DUF2877 domain-containing protein [Armatimonadota bacterium]MDR5696198.1 DUF2877 domain-containing protein [Armatimonadota bacterium]